MPIDLHELRSRSFHGTKRRIYHLLEEMGTSGDQIWPFASQPVSYTHLDVYKRQVPIQVPIGAEDKFHGIVDLFTMKKVVYTDCLLYTSRCV